LNDHPQTLDVTLSPEDNQRLANLCGQLDEHLRLLESELGVELNNRGNIFRIIGKPGSAQVAGQVLRQLYSEAVGGVLTRDQVRLAVREALDDSDDDDLPTETELKVKHFRGTSIRPRGATQRRYLGNITTCDINFGIGPAGTGKTYLAVACAVEALEREQVQRIVLVRPAVEAGERLGFLPGDLAQKIDPYLRPLYDALYEMLGFERVMKLIERNVIEVAPLAYMRGRTLNDAFIILDEAQNATVEQMKMFLTRTGFGSTVVVTGDITQIDLPRNQVSGLRQIVTILKDIDGVSFTFFQASDVVRHPLVQRIVEAYDLHDRGLDDSSTTTDDDH
jgi:phosphate starvation-inducible PhoH-like protein